MNTLIWIGYLLSATANNNGPSSGVGGTGKSSKEGKKKGDVKIGNNVNVKSAKKLNVRTRILKNVNVRIKN